MNFPFTIWRQALVEMWKLFLLTTAVLVTVVSFALTVKFFAEGRLGPIETLHFMVLAMVPMLQYTIPFAACFAATMVYHRMASDNEVTAAYAGGIGHRSLLAPALVSGVLLAGAVSLLTEEIVPRFLWKMEDLVSRKVAKIVMNSIERRQPIQQNGTMIYADEVAPAPVDQSAGVQDAMVLYGIVVTRFDEAGNLVFEAVARQGLVQVYPGRGSLGGQGEAAEGAGAEDGASEGGATGRSTTMVVVSLKDASGKTNGKRFSGDDVSRVFAIPGGVEDDPKFYTWGGLRDLRRHPDSLRSLDRNRRDLAYHLGERAACAKIKEVLNSDGRATLTAQNGESFVVEARDIEWRPGSRNPGVARWELLPGPAGTIAVDRYSAGPGAGPAVHFAARSGGLTTEMGDDPSRRHMLFRLELETVASSAGAGEAPAGGSGTAGSGAGQAGAAELNDQTFTGLSLDENPLPALLKLSSSELLAMAEPRITGPNADKFLIPPTRELRFRSEKLQREITSKQHERMAMSAAGLVMILTGAVSALRLRGRLPLTVYLWSFFPALGTVLTISAGQQMVEPMGNVGLILLWGGVAALAMYSLAAYRVVARH